MEAEEWKKDVFWNRGWVGGSLKWRKFIRWRVAVGIKMGWVFADMGCTILAHDADS